MSMDDDTFEIGDKSYQKIHENIEKSGYREGAIEGRDSVFQKSFDAGYEDGFRIGLAMGKSQSANSSRGNCKICSEPALMQKSEAEIRDIHKKTYENEF